LEGGKGEDGWVDGISKEAKAKEKAFRLLGWMDGGETGWVMGTCSLARFDMAGKQRFGLCLWGEAVWTEDGRR